jgi:hypothetical protein
MQLRGKRPHLIQRHGSGVTTSAFFFFGTRSSCSAFDSPSRPVCQRHVTLLVRAPTPWPRRDPGIACLPMQGDRPSNTHAHGVEQLIYAKFRSVAIHQPSPYLQDLHALLLFLWTTYVLVHGHWNVRVCELFDLNNPFSNSKLLDPS